MLTPDRSVTNTVCPDAPLQGHPPISQLLRIWAAYGSELHPSLEIALPKVRPLPGMALANDWLMGGSKGPAPFPRDNSEGPSHLQRSPCN